MISEYFKELLFPRLCIMCMKETAASSTNNFCVPCTVNMPYTNHFKKKDNLASHKFWGRIPCQHVASMINFYGYSDVKEMMHRLKYQGRRDIGYTLGKMAGYRASNSNFFKDIDLIVPIPLHPTKLLKRGYNQATQIAHGISEIMDIKIREDVVEKHIYTNSQTKMGRIERVKNVYTSFRLRDKEGIRGRHILIVDDVLTTGATIEACGNRLLESEGVKLSVLTACIARS